MKRKLQISARFFWGAVASLIIGIAMLIQVGRLVAPQVSDWRLSVQFYLQQYLGHEVTLGAIVANWDALSPEVELQKVSVSADGLPSLQVERVVLQVDLLRSLLALDWRFGRMEIDGVSASLQQSMDGRWSLLGFEPPGEQRRLKINPLELPLLANYAHLRDMRLTFFLRGGREQGLNLSSLVVRNDADFHRVTAELDLPAKNDTLKFVYEGYGLPGSDSSSGEGYLSLDQYPLVHSVAFASEAAAGKAGIRDGLLSAQLWLRAQSGKFLAYEGSLQYQRQEQDDTDFPAAIAASLRGQWHADSGWQVGLRDIRSRWKKRDTEVPLMLISGGFKRQNIDVQLTQLDLGYWSNLAAVSAAVPATVRSILGELKVQGQLHNLAVSVPLHAPQDFVLRVNLKSVSLDDWKGAPRVANLDGYIEASARSGSVQIDSGQQFALHFPLVFDRPFEFNSAVGEVAWQVNPDANQVLVNSGLLNMVGELGIANGYFNLDIPIERDSRLTELTLQLGLQQGSARQRGELMPKLIPEKLRAWVNRAAVAGKIPAGGFVLRGQFGKLGDGEQVVPRSIQLALDVRDSTLRFDEDWPALEDFSGRLLLDAPELDGWVDSGNFFETNVQAARVSLRQESETKGNILNIQGTVDGDAGTGLELLRSTPIREKLGGAFDDWQLSGALQANIDLQVPLFAQGQHRQHILVDLKDGKLQLPKPELDFTHLQTQLEYSSAAGLNSKDLSAELWGESVAAQISSDRASPTQPWMTRIAFTGALDLEQFAYRIARPELLFMQGKPDLRGELLVDGSEVKLQVTSDLVGVKVDLPAPFGKSARQSRALDVSLPISGNSFGLDINYADRLYARFKFPAQESVFGTVSVGADRPAREAGIWIMGELANVNGRQWRPLLERYKDYSELISSRQSAITSSAGVKPPPPSLRFDTKVNNFRWDKFEFKETRVGGGQVDEGWSFRLDNSILAGDIHLFTDERAPVIDLDYLNWETQPLGEEAEASEERDALEDFDPAGVQPFHLKIDDLKINAESYGQWSMDFQPHEKGLLIDNIHAVVRHLEISGQKDHPGTGKTGEPKKPGAQLLWLKGDVGEWTRFSGSFSGTNLENVTDAWHLPRLLASKSVYLGSNLTWPGSPTLFSVKHVVGNLEMDIRDGHFYQSTGQASSAFLRLVGLFNFDNWAKRLQLDFSDVFKEGIAFEDVNGNLRFASGRIHLDEPLEVRNTSSKMLMGGRINLLDETLDTSLVATLPVGGNATLITALIAGFPAAAGVYLASKLFEKQVDKVASLSYRINGPWADPEIKFDKLFDNTAADKASKNSRKQGSSETGTGTGGG